MRRSGTLPTPARIEWPTLALVAGCYGLFGLALYCAGEAPALAFLLAVLAIVLHSSLCHETIHGHPFPWKPVNEALVFPAIGLLVPWRRFRDTHLAHHRDSNLTDPYDDPESNYMDPAAWGRLGPAMQRLLAFNNTLVGRMLVGPVLGQWAFMKTDLRAIRAGDRAALAGWLWHVPAVALALAWVAVSAMPVWLWLAACYVAMSVLKIRTFLEHQAHQKARGRTVIIEDRGPLAFLFLNNNLHVVHHMHPRTPWYQLPPLYFQNRERYLTRNDGYMFRSYAEVFRRHFLSAKDPVPHPLWPGEDRAAR